MLKYMESIIDVWLERGRKKGIARTLVKNAETLSRNMPCSLEHACRLLGSSIEEYNEAKDFLKTFSDEAKEVG